MIDDGKHERKQDAVVSTSFTITEVFDVSFETDFITVTFDCFNSFVSSSSKYCKEIVMVVVRAVK